MKKLLRLLATVLCAALLVVPIFCSACKDAEEKTDNDDTQITDLVDYASTVKLDMTSNTKKQKVTVKLYIDGDTTHFDPVSPSAEDKAVFDTTQGYIKARYIAVDTPESTGGIEEWGKKASNFTHDRLASANNDIIVESDSDKWDIDSTGERYVLWIWYKPVGETEYRNLNIELLQAGLARGSSTANNRYGTAANSALTQAQKAKLYVFSGEKDPDYYYGTAIPLTLKELRCHASDYNLKKVVVDGTIVAQFDNSVYIEDYDTETGLYFGMPVFYGYTSGKLLEILSVGNRVKVVGTLSEFQGSYQISGVMPYNAFEPDDPDNCQIISQNQSPAYAETSASDIVKGNLTVTFIKEVPDGDPVVDNVSINYGEAIMSTTVTVKDLTVTKAYTTNNGGDNDGAISLTCKAADGTTITVRTTVLKENGVLVTQDRYVGKKITAQGVIEQYNGDYQVKCYRVDQITIIED
ncbi:MAG: thermonuclease family protein [Roseburia sp.]|nr:thermonuclease family protein [Roseburia sp.]